MHVKHSRGGGGMYWGVLTTMNKALTMWSFASPWAEASNMLRGTPMHIAAPESLGSWFISDISSLLPVSVSLIGNVVSAVTALWQ